MNANLDAYERAAERFNRASENWAKANAARILQAAEDEYDAASADLARYETSPGLPLPEFRPGYHEHNQER